MVKNKTIKSTFTQSTAIIFLSGNFVIFLVNLLRGRFARPSKRSYLGLGEPHHCFSEPDLGFN